MKGYRFITDDDTVDFCQRVTEALSNGEITWRAKMTFDHKRKVMRCGQAVVKQSSKKYKKYGFSKNLIIQKFHLSNQLYNYFYFPHFAKQLSLDKQEKREQWLQN